MSIARSCGTCNLCCTVMAVGDCVPEPKPKNVKCRQLTVLGQCGIYAERPQSCRDFRCLWLMGMLPEELKPSRVNAVADANGDGTMIVFHIHPRDRGAHRRGALGRFIEQTRDRLTFIVACGDERSVTGKDARRVLEVVEQHHAD